MSAAVAQLTDKNDIGLLLHMNRISDIMMHVQKKIRSAILDFGKKGKKPLFSAGTQHTGHLEGWLY